MLSVVRNLTPSCTRCIQKLNCNKTCASNAFSDENAKKHINNLFRMKQAPRTKNDASVVFTSENTSRKV